MWIVLQWSAGGLYLLNKIFFSFAERARRSGRPRRMRRWKIASWAVYLGGLPPWIILFGHWHNWIAAAVEAAGAPAMALGLANALRGVGKDPPRWLDWLALAFVPIGFAVSLYDFGGLTKLTQWLEIALVAGYLIGTYDLAKDRMRGYLWFVLMHVACGTLMWKQRSPWLAAQQAVSLLFIADAYITRRRSSAHRHNAPPGG